MIFSQFELMTVMAFYSDLAMETNKMNDVEDNRMDEKVGI